MSWVKISSGSESAASSVTVTGFTSTYDVHMLKIKKLHQTAANNYIDGRFTTNTPSAGTPITASNYGFSAFLNHSNFSAGAFTSTNLSYTDKWRATYIGQNNTGQGYHGEMLIYNAADATKDTVALWNFAGVADAGNIGLYIGGVHLDQNSVVDGVQFFPVSGSANIDELDWVLYGLQES